MSICKLGSVSLYSISAVFVVLAAAVPSLNGGEDAGFAECSRPFSCGIFKNLSFPFWSDSRPRYCGHEGYKLRCNGNGSHPVIVINEGEFQILRINQSAQPQMMTLSRWDSGKDSCPTALNYYRFKPAKTVVNVTLLRSCSESDHSRKRIEASHRIRCTVDGETTTFLFMRDNETHLVDCGDKVEVSVPKEALKQLNSGTMSLNKTLMSEFNVQYFAYDEYCLKCKGSGGRCGSSQSSSQSFACYCSNRPYDVECGSKDTRNWPLKVGIGVGCGVVGGILIASIGFILYQRRKKALKYARSYLFSQDISSPPPTDFEMGGFPGVHQFSYTELEKATNKFDSKRELGDGGFGTVYYGKLRDGRPVAVKRLYENNYKRVEQFWNEVVILAQLRHPNLVSLYGYTSRHSRELLLVYEYISNGTVADHLHGERAERGSLSWSIRLKIAIETASALTYLHASDIIHRDVKTDNILLDENFCVKVADFGLSRLFPLNATHVSTTPQGTPGYVDPEYHECYQLTDKSDVFSFGVVLIELISSMPAVDITRHRHEINLSNMAINKIQNQALHELVDPSLGFESDNEIRAMITSVAKVAFQCLQGGKDKRPTMEEVHEALKCIQSGNYNEGKVEEMEITADEVVSLKSRPLTLSPDSVAIKWISISSTSNAST